MEHFFTIWGGFPQNFKVIKATLISFPGNQLFAHHCIIQYLIIIFLKLPSLRRYNSYLSKPSHTGQSCCSIYSVRHDCHLQFNNIIDKVWPVFCFFLKKRIIFSFTSRHNGNIKGSRGLSITKMHSVMRHIHIYAYVSCRTTALLFFTLQRRTIWLCFFLYTDLSIKRIIHRKTG